MARVDYDYLEQLREIDRPGNPPVADELIGIFLDTAPGRLHAIEAALLGHDEGAARREAHGLKSTCLNVGARGMAQLCGQIETGKKEALLGFVSELGAELDYVCEELRGYRRQRYGS